MEFRKIVMITHPLSLIYQVPSVLSPSYILYPCYTWLTLCLWCCFPPTCSSHDCHHDLSKTLSQQSLSSRDSCVGPGKAKAWACHLQQHAAASIPTSECHTKLIMLCIPWYNMKKRLGRFDLTRKFHYVTPLFKILEWLPRALRINHKYTL